MQIKILVAGHVCVDLTPDLKTLPSISAGNLSDIGKLRTSAGGCVFNTSLVLKNLGANVQIETGVGSDFIGNLTSQLIIDADISIKKLHRITDSPGSYSIVINPKNGSSNRTFWHCSGANGLFTGAQMVLDGIDILHFGYPQLMHAISDNNAENLFTLFSRVKQQNKVTSLDFAVLDSQSVTGKQDWYKIIQKIAPVTDILTPSLDDMLSTLPLARVLNAYEQKEAGCTNLSEAEIAAIRAFDPKENQNEQREILAKMYAKLLVSCGVAFVAISDGDAGFYIHSGSEKRMQTILDVYEIKNKEEWINKTFVQKALKLVGPQNTTGAGDAASAAWLVALELADNMNNAAEIVSAVSATKVSGLELSWQNIFYYYPEETKIIDNSR